MARPKTSKRRRRAAPWDTYDTANAKDFRRLNEPGHNPIFRPPTVLDPSQVRDQRYEGMVMSIARWFGAQSNILLDRWGNTGPKVQAAANTPLGRLQEGHNQYKQSRSPQPMPGPAPRPSRIANPGLLSKYRR